MRSTLALSLAVLLPALSATAQNQTIDLNLWTEEHINGSGPWVVDAPRLFVNSTNTVNTDCSVFYSDFVANYVEFRMSVNPAGGDDDLIGFVLGWNPGDSSNSSADYLLVDWKRTTQSYQDWGTASAGLALSHVQGQFTRGFGGAPIDLWSHTGVCTELARSSTYGQTGWEFGTDYHFRVLFVPGNITIWVNDVIEFQQSGTFNPGRFGCYNYSQSRTEFQFALTGSFTSFGTGCAGTFGTPYLFAPETPLIGRNLPIVIANLPPTAMPILMLGLSNTTWRGLTLPLSLAPLGAAGCDLLTSSDVFLPVSNFNGTAYINFAIPRSAVPSATPALFAQGLALDPGANQLGTVVSNGAAITIGIR